MTDKTSEQTRALEEFDAKFVQVSENVPTSDKNKIWINPNGEKYIVPEIDDANEKDDDTWSSRKIAAEINKVLQLHESVKLKQDEILRALSTINARLDALAQNTEEA